MTARGVDMGFGGMGDSGVIGLSEDILRVRLLVNLVSMSQER